MRFINRNIVFIRSGIVSGLVFALITASFDYFNDQPFSVLKFAMHSVFFGLFNGYMVYRKFKKDQNEAL